MPAAWLLVSSKIQTSRMSFTFSWQKLLPYSFTLQAQNVESEDKDLDTVQQNVGGFAA